MCCGAVVVRPGSRSRPVPATQGPPPWTVPGAAGRPPSPPLVGLPCHPRVAAEPPPGKRAAPASAAREAVARLCPTPGEARGVGFGLGPGPLSRTHARSAPPAAWPPPATGGPRRAYAVDGHAWRRHAVAWRAMCTAVRPPALAPTRARHLAARPRREPATARRPNCIGS